MFIRIFIVLFSLSLGAQAQSQFVLPEANFEKMHSIYESVFKLSQGFYQNKCHLTHHSASEMVSQFQKGLKKMVDVNKWDKIIGIPGQTFKLHKVSPSLSYKFAEIGDYIEVELPADPTRRSYWVKIESYSLKHLSPYEKIFTMVLRPTRDPARKKSKKVITDHFFTNAATNTLKLRLSNNTIVATIHGEAEEANVTQAPTWFDGLANQSIVRMSWGMRLPEVGQIGFQKLVWHKLTKEVVDCNI